MKRTRLVGITKTSEVTLLGSADQRKLNSIRRITKSDPSLAKVFAEPVLDANDETISWYTDLSGSISPYDELSSSDKRFLEMSWATVCEKLKGLRESLNSVDRVILDNVVEIPGLAALHLVGHELLVTDWSSVRVGFRPKNKNIGIDLYSEPAEQGARSHDRHVEDVSVQKSNDKDLGIAELEVAQDLEISPNNFDEQQAPLGNDTNDNRSEPKKGFFYSLWFWGSLFLILCCLNWFLLIDACGVEGVQFLNFCR